MSYTPQEIKRLNKAELLHYVMDTPAHTLDNELFEAVLNRIQMFSRTQADAQRYFPLYIAEKQRRTIEKLSELVEQQGKNSGRVSRRSLWVSLLALVIAGMALFLSIQDYKGDAEWKAEQINVLTDIREIISPEK